MSIWFYYWKISNFHAISRAIALPVATQCMISKVKSDERISKFVLSLGVTLNNNGMEFERYLKWNISLNSHNFRNCIFPCHINDFHRAFNWRYIGHFVNCHDCDCGHCLFNVNAICSRRCFTYIAGCSYSNWCGPSKCFAVICHWLDIVSWLWLFSWSMINKHYLLTNNRDRLRLVVLWLEIVSQLLSLRKCSRKNWMRSMLKRRQRIN